MSADQITALLYTYKYFVLFPIAIIEGPLATLVAGVFVTLGLLNPWVVYVIMVTGDMLGDMGYYTIGRFGSPRVKQWALHFFKLDLDAVATFFSENPHKTLMVSKVIHGIGVSGIIGAGIVRFPFLRFVRICSVVSILQVGVLLVLGVVFGSSYVIIKQYLGYISAILSTVALIMVAWRYITNGKKKST